MRNSYGNIQAKIWLTSFLIAGLILLFQPALPADALPIPIGGHRYVSKIGSDSGSCLTSLTACATINYAIEQANTGDTIHIAAGTYGAVTLDADKNLVFSGAGKDSTRIDGGGTARAFFIMSPVNTKINDLTIQHGHSDACGGGLAHFGGVIKAPLELVRVWVTENTANCGAGIFSEGNLTITNSSITNNSATNFGGGMYLNGVGTSATLTNVTISGNSAIGEAGAINNNNHNSTSGSMVLTNVTISDNTANGKTAMNINNEAQVTIVNSTIANNHRTSAAYPGGIYNLGSVVIKNSILAGNDSANCSTPVGTSATWTSEGNNIDSGASCQFNNVSKNDRQNTDPLLASLAFNGGLVKTMALLAGSPAIDGVTYNAPNGCPAADARLFPRPLGGLCDIGAYEFAANAIFLPFIKR
jgi:hypothetical protein